MWGGGVETFELEGRISYPNCQVTTKLGFISLLPLPTQSPFPRLSPFSSLLLSQILFSGRSFVMSSLYKNPTGKQMKPPANDQVSEFGRGSFISFREAEASAKSSTVVS